MELRKILFFSLGLTCVYPSEAREKINDRSEKLQESPESKSCRRKILTLSGIIVLTGLSGADPNNISVFGVEPTANRIWVLLFAIVVIQLYWYFLKYHHLKEDGEIEPTEYMRSQNSKYEKPDKTHIPLVRKSADLSANYVAFILTISSWYFVGCWIV